MHFLLKWVKRLCPGQERPFFFLSVGRTYFLHVTTNQTVWVGHACVSIQKWWWRQHTVLTQQSCKSNIKVKTKILPLSSMPLIYSWQWPTSSSSWWTVRGTSRCCVKHASTSGCCSAAVRPWETKTTHCTRRCRGCLRGWLHRPCSQWHSGTNN